MPPKLKFGDGEKVLCYHGLLVYEAKIIKSKKEAKGNDAQYLVHYQGWNKNWDEWVPDSRMLKINADSLALKKRLEAEQLADKKEKKKSGKKGAGGGDGGKSSGSSSSSATAAAATAATPPSGASGGSAFAGTGASSGSASGSRKQSESASTSRASTPVSERSAKLGKRRDPADDERSISSRDEEDQGEEEREQRESSSKTRKKPRRSSSSGNVTPVTTSSRTRGREAQQPAVEASFQLTLPEELRIVLQNDFNLITKKSNLFTIPAKVTVASIASDFVSKNPARSQFNAELMESLKSFFDARLGRELLYRFERQQYVSAKKAHPNRRPCELYGSAHLVRLMANLDSCMEETRIKSKTSVDILENAFEAFLDFLEENSSTYFTSKNYSEAEDNYIKNAEA